MELLRHYLPRASAAHYPAVGWLVGFAGCAAFALVGLALPPSPFATLAAAAASTAVTVLLRGPRTNQDSRTPPTAWAPGRRLHVPSKS
jgi:hypothetical protein